MNVGNKKAKKQHPFIAIVFGYVVLNVCAFKCAYSCIDMDACIHRTYIQTDRQTYICFSDIYAWFRKMLNYKLYVTFILIIWNAKTSELKKEGKTLSVLCLRLVLLPVSSSLQPTELEDRLARQIPAADTYEL